jgi:hypothetical protein
MEEVTEMEQFHAPQFSSSSPQIWTGDFNALTRDDYTDEFWQEAVVNVRERNSWETPKTDLTKKVIT